MADVLGTFFDNVTDVLAGQFDGRVQTIALWDVDAVDKSPVPTKPLPLPAIMIEVEFGDIDTDDDLGDGRAPLRMKLSAHCVMGSETPALKINLFKFASEMAATVFNNQWNDQDATVGHPEKIGVSPGGFGKKKEGWESWVCDWEQVVYLGDDAWDELGFVPSKVFYGRAPDVGTDKADYEQVV